MFVMSTATLDAACASNLFVIELKIKVKPSCNPINDTSFTSPKLTFGFGAKVSATIEVFGLDLIVARPIEPVVLIFATIAILTLCYSG